MVQVSRLGGGLLQTTEATDCTKGLLISQIQLSFDLFNHSGELRGGHEEL